jgi:hypothetical protein
MGISSGHGTKLISDGFGDPFLWLEDIEAPDV